MYVCMYVCIYIYIYIYIRTRASWVMRVAPSAARDVRHAAKRTGVPLLTRILAKECPAITGHLFNVLCQRTIGTYPACAG